MCTVTATQFKEQFGKMLELALTEEILVTKNGKPFVRILSAKGSATWEDFFNEYEGSMNEKDVDISDPIAAGIIGKL